MSDNYINEDQLQTIERMTMHRTWQDMTTLKNETLTAMIGAIRGLRVTLAAAIARAEAAEADRDALARDVAGLQYRIEQKDDRNVDLRAQLAAAVARAEEAEAQLALVDIYGQYMRHAPFPCTFTEWLVKRQI